MTEEKVNRKTHTHTHIKNTRPNVSVDGKNGSLVFYTMYKIADNK